MAYTRPPAALDNHPAEFKRVECGRLLEECESTDLPTDSLRVADSKGMIALSGQFTGLDDDREAALHIHAALSYAAAASRSLVLSFLILNCAEEEYDQYYETTVPDTAAKSFKFTVGPIVPVSRYVSEGGALSFRLLVKSLESDRGTFALKVDRLDARFETTDRDDV